MRSLFFRGTFFFRLFDAKKKQKQQQQKEDVYVVPEDKVLTLDILTNPNKD